MASQTTVSSLSSTSSDAAAPAAVEPKGSYPYATSLADIRRAAERIEGKAHRTPVHSSRLLNEMSGGLHLTFKCELFQRTGAFKFRGALNAILSLAEEQRAAVSRGLRRAAEKVKEYASNELLCTLLQHNVPGRLAAVLSVDIVKLTSSIYSLKLGG